MLDRSSLLLAASTLVFALASVNAHARGCGDPKPVSAYEAATNPGAGVPYTEKEKARQALEKKIDQMYANDGNPSMLYVVLPSKKDGESEVLRVPYPEGEHMELTKEQLAKLQKYKEVKVFNKSKNGSIYFLPYTEQGLKGAIPQYDFRAARMHDRYAGGGCNILSFQDPHIQYMSAVSGTLATWGDKVADTQRNAIGNQKKMMSKSDADLYKESVDILTKKFKAIQVSGRRLAVENASPYGEKVDKRLDKLLKDNPDAVINFGNDGMPYVQKTTGAK